MKFISVISKLLGMPKMLKNKHTLEFDLVVGDEAICLKHFSYNQNDTVMFLKSFYKELVTLRKFKEDKCTSELEKEIPLLIKMFTVEKRNYILMKDSDFLVKEIHLINLRLVNDKKTIIKIKINFFIN